MSDQAKLKESIKKSIRGLVLSAPLGLTPKEVELDYASFEGRPLPYRQLGYNTCQDFLQDIPDTVRAQWERGHLVVRAVGGESTMRIQSLVSRQKVDVQKCLKKRRGASLARTQTQTDPESSAWRPGAGQTRTPLPGIAFNSRPKPRGPPAVPPTVPAYVRNQIKSFLTEQPNGVLNTQFDRLFAEKFGHTICCNKLGFESLGHMCQVLSEFVHLEKLHGGEFRIYERTHYQSRQSSPKNMPSSVRPGQVNSTEHISGENLNSSISLSVSDVKEPLTSSYSSKQANIYNNFKQDEVPEATFQNRDAAASRQPPPSQNASLGRSTSQPARESEQRQIQDVRPRIPSDSAQSAGSAPDADTSADASRLTSELFETKFLEEIQQILVQHPEGLWAAYLSDEYKKKYKKALPMMSLGYFSVTELMAAMPGVVAIEREQKQGDWKLYDVRTYKPKTTETATAKPISTTQSAENQREDASDPSKGFQELKIRVRQLLEKYPEGILLKNLPLYYQRAFCATFPIEELGFRDVESLIMMMPDIATVVYKGYGRLLVVLAEESSRQLRKTIPADAVDWGFSYSYYNNPPIQEYIEVYVATVFTPHRLSIQLKDKQRNDALDDIMDSLESVYSYPEGNKYEFPESMVAVGQVCCALYLSDNNWHRGLITGIPKVDFVEVLYVDYGTVANVSRSSLRLLKSCFFRLPIQAFRGRLAFIEPVEDKWTNEARDRLLAMTAGKPLIALITETQGDELFLLLSDTTTDEDIHINDAMVEAGLANFARTLEDVDQPLPPPVKFGQFSEDEMSDSELDLLTLNDIILDDHDDVDNYEHPEANQEKEKFEDPSEEVDNEAELPQLEKVSNPSSEDKSTDMPQLEATTDDVPWNVKRIDLADSYRVHLINHDNEACLTVAEVADLICSEDDSEPEEFLCQQVRMLGVDIPLVTVTESENPRLFEELRRVELLDNSENSPELLAMIPFTSALLLLSSTGTVSMDIVQQLQEIAEELGVFGDMFGSEVSDAAIDELDLSLDLEELITTLEALKFKRKRILGAMIQSTDSNFVDELSYIERKIDEISKRVEVTKALLQQQEMADKTDSAIGNNPEMKRERLHVSIPLGPHRSRDRVPHQPETPGTPDPLLTTASNSDGAPKSPGRLVQAVEPRPRDEDLHTKGSQLKEASVPRVQQSELVGSAPSLTQAAGQSQGQGQPSANQIENLSFPNPVFPNQGATQYLPLQHRGAYFGPCDPAGPRFPVMGGAHHGYQQHLGSGDFIPPPHTVNPQTWLGPPHQGTFVNPFPSPQPFHLVPLPMGHPPSPFMGNPQGYIPGSGGPVMPSQARGGQGSWW